MRYRLSVVPIQQPFQAPGEKKGRIRSVKISESHVYLKSQLFFCHCPATGKAGNMMHSPLTCIYFSLGMRHQEIIILPLSLIPNFFFLIFKLLILSVIID